MAQLETNSESRTKHLKTYESPKIKEHYVVETESFISPGSIRSAIKEGGIKDKRIEEVLEIFIMEW